MTFRSMIKNELKFQQSMLRQYKRLAKIKESGTLICKHRKSGRVEYYIRGNGADKAEYVNSEKMDRVHRLQLRALGEAGVEKTEMNAALLEEVLDKYDEGSVSDLIQTLPPSYRLRGLDEKKWQSTNRRRPFPQSEKTKYREYLIHSTSFGLMVRSKNEGQIAEGLMTTGLEFYYEKALQLRTPDGKTVTIYPDFTIVMPDGRRIYWEHKGMLDMQKYADDDMRRTRLYYYNGIYQPMNLIVTCDGPGGEYPGVEIGMIVEFLAQMAAVSRI